MKKNTKIIIGVLVALAAIFVIIIVFVRPSPTLCKLLGGEYTTHARYLGSDPACGFKPAPDGNKECVSSDECFYDCTQKGDVMVLPGTCEDYDYWLGTFFLREDYEGTDVESFKDLNIEIEK